MVASLAWRGIGVRAGRRAALVGFAAAARLALASQAPILLVSSGVAVAVTSSASAENAPSSLPRQFAVEVGPAGVLFADGSRLGAPSELVRWAQRAVVSARYAGAVVFGDPVRDARAVAEIMETLRSAGFAEVRSAGRAAPPELSAIRAGAAPLVTANTPAAMPAPAASSPGAAVSAARPAPAEPRRPRVTLASAGLHVGGKLNQEPHRGRLVRVFEQQFAAFRRCHERAEAHEQGASFGVDLLIPKEGGRGSIRETRSRLQSKGFRSCMRGVFESIRFAPPPTERPEIVSYSVLFKPSAR
jgi:hypothetical protein